MNRRDRLDRIERRLRTAGTTRRGRIVVLNSSPWPPHAEAITDLRRQHGLDPDALLVLLPPKLTEADCLPDPDPKTPED